MSPSVYINIVHESEKKQESRIRYSSISMCFFSDWHVIKHNSYNARGVPWVQGGSMGAVDPPFEKSALFEKKIK